MFVDKDRRYEMSDIEIENQVMNVFTAVLGGVYRDLATQFRDNPAFEYLCCTVKEQKTLEQVLEAIIRRSLRNAVVGGKRDGGNG